MTMPKGLAFSVFAEFAMLVAMVFVAMLTAQTEQEAQRAIRGLAPDPPRDAGASEAVTRQSVVVRVERGRVYVQQNEVGRLEDPSSVERLRGVLRKHAQDRPVLLSMDADSKLAAYAAVFPAMGKRRVELHVR